MPAAPTPLMTALRRRGVVWLALWIALLLPLVPTLSHALAWARGEAALVAICTTTGQRWVVPGQPEAETGAGVDNPSEIPGSAVALVHCPFCVLSADHSATPPLLLVAHLLVPGSAVSTLSWQAFFPLLLPTVVPPPRGPPTLLSFSFHSA
jgi:hypothetical protein